MQKHLKKFVGNKILHYLCITKPKRVNLTPTFEVL